MATDEAILDADQKGLSDHDLLEKAMDLLSRTIETVGEVQESQDETVRREAARLARIRTALERASNEVELAKVTIRGRQLRRPQK